MSSEDVRDVVLALNTEFTQGDIMDLTNASCGTVGKVVKRLTEEKTIKELGGRPRKYRRA